MKCFHSPKEYTHTHTHAPYDEIHRTSKNMMVKVRNDTFVMEDIGRTHKRCFSSDKNVPYVIFGGG